MKMNLLFFLAALTAGCVCGETKKSNITATAVMSDGSCIKGALMERSFHGSTLFDPDLELSADLVHAMTFTGTNGEAKVELTNRDTFALTLANTTIDIDALIGKTTLRREVLKSLRLTHHAAQPEAGLLFHCTFDSEEAIRHPEIGPEGSVYSATFEEGFSGKALLATPFKPAARFTFTPGLLKKRGCIELRAKIRNDTPYVGNGGDPRLFSMSSTGWGETFCMIDLVSNDGGGNSGISTWTLLGTTVTHRGCSSYLVYDDLLGDGTWQEWHHYAVVWDTDGISSLPGSPRFAALLDGKPLPNAKSHDRPAEQIEDILNGSILLGFTGDPAKSTERNTKSPVLIDEFKIWDYAKTDFDL